MVSVPALPASVCCQQCFLAMQQISTSSQGTFLLLQGIKDVRCHAGVLLGDIKPANFMLRKYYKDPIAAIEMQQLGPSWLKAIDFGCSQSVGHSRLQRRTGTPVYMSPETFRREYYLEAE